MRIVYLARPPPSRSFRSQIGHGPRDTASQLGATRGVIRGGQVAAVRPQDAPGDGQAHAGAAGLAAARRLATVERLGEAGRVARARRPAAAPPRPRTSLPPR